jgi:hypothetical protein
VGLIDATDLPAACGGFKKIPNEINASHSGFRNTLSKGKSQGTDGPLFLGSDT